MGARQVFIAAVAVIATATGAWLSYRVARPPAEPEVATVLPVHSPLPAFSLLDEAGRPAGPEFFEGNWDLVFFGFTHCPDVCPLTLQVLADARRQMQESGAAALPRIVLVSVDPERDTPDALAGYLQYFGEGTAGLTGELAEVRTLTDALGIFFQTANADGDSYSVDHSAAVLVIDPDGRFRALFSAPHTAAGFVHDLPLIMSST